MRITKKAAPNSYALITGASSGMGREYALQLAALGYNIIVVSNLATQNDEVASYIKEHNSVDAISREVDLSSIEQVRDLYEWTKSSGYRVDILISNAGILHFGAFLSMSVERIELMLNLHCGATTLLCRLYSEDMCKRGCGRILITSSATVWMPYPSIACYTASKAYISKFATALYYELIERGVTVTCVYPGAIDTPLYDLNEKTRVWLRRFGVLWSASKLAKRGIGAMFRGRRRLIPGVFTKIAVAFCSILPMCTLRLALKLKLVRRILEIQ